MLGKFRTIRGAVCAAALAAAPAALAEPLVKPLADNVYMMSEFRYVSLVVVGDEGVLITDPAFSARAESMKAAIAGITDKPVTHIVLSHEHYDHVGGTEVFPDARVICHAACQAVFDLDILGIVPETVHVTWSESHEVDFAGPAVRLSHHGPADGFGYAVVHLPEARIAFTADLYGDRAVTPGWWMDDDNYLAILRVLRVLDGMDLVHAVNSHSDDTSPANVSENLAFVEDLFALVNGEIGAALREGGPARVVMSLDAWQNDLKLPRYADWRGYDEHLPIHVRRMALSIFHGG